MFIPFLFHHSFLPENVFQFLRAEGLMEELIRLTSQRMILIGAIRAHEENNDILVHASYLLENLPSVRNAVKLNIKKNHVRFP